MKEIDISSQSTILSLHYVSNILPKVTEYINIEDNSFEEDISLLQEKLGRLPLTVSLISFTYFSISFRLSLKRVAGSWD